VPDVVHIGYPKTASTFLQTHVFPNLDGCAFLTHWGDAAAELRPLIRNLYWADDDHYLQETLRTFIAEWRTAHPGPLLLSDENLAGGLYPIDDNWERNARRIHDQLPDAHVLVVVREQRALMRSAYSLHVQRGGYVSFADLLAGRAERARFVPEIFCFHHLVVRYRELFGADRVTVMPYEQLARDPGRFASEVSSLVSGRPVDVPQPTGSRANVSLSPVSLRIMRRTNRMFRKSTYNAHPTVRRVPAAAKLRPVLHATVDRVVPPSFSRRIDDGTPADLADVLEMFAESNTILEQLTGLQLGALGYVLESEQDARRSTPSP